MEYSIIQMIKRMKILFLLLLLQSACAKKDSSGPNINPGQGENPVKSDITAWITSPDNYILFQKQSASLNFATLSNSNPVIEVDSTKTYQEIDGFGNCLTGGSAMLIHHMDQASRSALLKELFASDSNNIGISYLRISIGASDLNDHVFSYDDMPAGQVDPALANFSVQEDKIDLIPVLKEILAINPSVKILCSPWSPPAWMKSNESSK